MRQQGITYYAFDSPNSSHYIYIHTTFCRGGLEIFQIKENVGLTIICQRPTLLTKQYTTLHQRRITDDYYCKFGLAMKAARKEKGLTQDQLARKLKISQSDVSKLEKGTYHESITNDMAARIAATLGRRIVVLLEKTSK